MIISVRVMLPNHRLPTPEVFFVEVQVGLLLLLVGKNRPADLVSLDHSFRKGSWCKLGDKGLLVSIMALSSFGLRWNHQVKSFENNYKN
jgi:hypothetical protein